MDATQIINDLNAEAILKELADLSARERALRVLLRAARARERYADAATPVREGDAAPPNQITTK